MKKLLMFVLALFTLASCKDNDPGPSINGTFRGPVSIKNELNGYGVTSYDEADITLKQLDATSVEVSSGKFQPFVITNLLKTGSSSYAAGDNGNIFRYSGNADSRSLLIDWTGDDINGKPQTIRFGGNKKK